MSKEQIALMAAQRAQRLGTKKEITTAERERFCAQPYIIQTKSGKFVTIRRGK